MKGKSAASVAKPTRDCTVFHAHMDTPGTHTHTCWQGVVIMTSMGVVCLSSAEPNKTETGLFLNIHNSNCVILWHRGCQLKQIATWITSRRLRRARHAKLKASALLYRAAAAGPPCICLFSAANWFLRHHSDSSGEAGDLKVLTLWKACTHVISLWNSARQLANSRGSEKQGCSGWKFLWTQTTKNTHTEVHVAFWSQLLFGSTVDLAYFAVWCFFNALPGREEFPTTN